MLRTVDRHRSTGPQVVPRTPSTTDNREQATVPSNDQPDYVFDEELAVVIPYLPKLDYTDVAAVREAAAGFAGAPPDLTGLTSREVQVPVPGGTIALRITTPEAGGRPMPLVYDVHPGGFCLGSAADMHPRDAVLARELGAVVAAPDYRLAPEHPYPTPLEDCYAGLQWLIDNAGALAIDPERVAVYGMSAGGGLAAGLTLLARDRGTPSIAFQYLAFPELDDRLTTGTMNRFVDTPLFHRPNAVASWNHYLGDLDAGSAEVPEYAAPSRATDLSGLPSAYVGVMQFDPLRDEGIDYARRLADADAGVGVELHLFPSTFHFSRAIEAAEVTQRELAEEIVVLRRALHGPAAPLAAHGSAATSGAA